MICEKCGMRLIDADALPHDFTVPRSMDSRAYFKGVQDVFETIDAAPTVPAEVLRHGRWKHIISWYPESDYDQCTNCGFTVSRGYGYNKPEWKFCPNCGARMDGQGEGDAE
jgi:rubrerythrin